MNRHHESGFTLTELAIVLAIVTLLVGGMLIPISAQYDARYVSDTQRQLNEAREALIGFVIANGYFPCPADATSSGLEAGVPVRNAVTNQCTNRVGLLPWATLGITRLDSWGRQFHYSVAKTFTDNSTLPSPSFALTATGDITIKGEAAVSLTNAGSVAAVILSNGKNGILGVTDSGTTIPNSSATNTDEQENGNATGTTFHDRIATTDPAANGGEIDDILVWIPTYTLMNKLVAARKLP